MSHEVGDRMDEPSTGSAAPRVTVGVPVYNGARFLGETLDALRAQSLRDIEVIVADNASTDGSLEIAEKAAAEDPRFRVVTADRNRGVPWNFNRLVDAARAPAFMWNASDDVARPDHLLRCVQALDDAPEATIAFSRVVLIDATGNQVGEMDDDGLDFESLDPAARVRLFFARHVYQVIGFGGVIRTAALRDLGRLPQRYGGDLELAVRMAVRAPWVQVPEQLYVSRRHDDQTNKVQGGDVLDQVRVYRPDWKRPVAFPQWSLDGALLRAAASAPLSWSGRAAAVGSVLGEWAIPNWRLLAFDLKRNAVRLVRGRYEGDYRPTASASDD
jgi:glycosyltransferase involved in cell wall biosynthesis